MTDVEIVLYGLMWSGGILVLNAIVVFALSGRAWINAGARVMAAGNDITIR
jgi:hypothetical protein